MEYTDKQVKDLLDGIHDGTITPYELPEDLYFSIADYLKKALYEGFGGNLSDMADTPDYALLQELRENIYMFSAAKTHAQVVELSSQLVQDDKVISLREFQKIGRDTFDTWNDDWGKSEFVTAKASAASAVKWADIERNKDILPNLRYSTIGDACDICAPLDGLTAPVDDPIWDNIIAPNHFNCLCIVTQEEPDAKLTPDDEKEAVYEESTDKMSDVFMMNSGKDKYIFSPEHPYFDVARKDKEFAADNFNLPIPKND